MSLLITGGHRVIIFGFSPQNLKDEAVAVASSMAGRGAEADSRDGAADQALDRLAAFRGELYHCLGRRRDVLFELADAVLCKTGRVHMLADLSLEPECRRGHGAVYDAISCGWVEIARLRRALASLPLPRWGDGRIRLGVDVSPWLRPEAVTSRSSRSAARWYRAGCAAPAP